MLKNNALKKIEQAAAANGKGPGDQDQPHLNKQVQRMMDVKAQKAKLLGGVGGDISNLISLAYLQHNQEIHMEHRALEPVQEIHPDLEKLRGDTNAATQNEVKTDKFNDPGIVCNSDIIQSLAENKKQNAVQRFFLSVCEHRYFNFLITFAIIANTIVLGLDGYPPNEDLQRVLDVINIIFFCLFFFEMVVKIVGMGPRLYIMDNYNIFDAIIVTLSIIDVSISYTLDPGDISSGKGAISAFRAFRLIRIFKLAKSWTKLQRLISMISKSLVDISSFSVLLFLLMFIYTLLGMELFSIKMEDEGSSPTKAKIPRNNFNTFFSSIIVIFTVLTGENWDETMLQYARYEAVTAILFFVSLIIIGVMIFLNLFLAILLDNFDDVEEEDDAGDGDSFKQRSISFVKNLFSQIFVRDEPQSPSQREPSHLKSCPTIKIEELKDDDSVKMDEDYVEDEEQNKEAQDMSYSMRDAHSNTELLPLSLLKNEFQNRVQVKPLEVIEESDEKSPSRTRSKFGGTGVDFRRTLDNGEDFMKGEADQTMLPQREGIDSQLRDQVEREIREYQVIEEEKDPGYIEEVLQLPLSNHLNNSVPNLHKELQNQDSLKKQKQRTTLEIKKFHSSYEADVSEIRDFSPEVKLNTSHKKVKSFALIMYQRQQSVQIRAQKSFISKAQCEGNSLFIFSNRNIIRVVIARITQSKYFEMFILFLICFSSILLAIDNPLNDPESGLVYFIFYADYVLTAAFTIEAIFKILTFGFLFNKSKSYLRNTWNIMDCLVVIVSIISVALESNKIKTVKILRLLRVLRPLRVISRDKGLKIGIQALFKALPNIFNVIVVSILFFIIFAIIGVNYFKGSFFYCQAADEVLFDVEGLVETKWDCFNFGGAWLNADQNFDNVGEAMSTLFQTATTEGWIDIMNRGVDSVGIDYQPVRNQNIYWALFFILFIILGNFFILNLFAGVVVSTFNREKQILEKTHLMLEHQMRWIEQKKLLLSFKPKVEIGKDANRCRKMLIRIVLSQKFEFFILGCIAANTIMLAMNWYSQTPEVDDIIDYVNYGFALIYVVEAIIKIIALGVRRYFSDNGNAFDFMIVLASIISSIFSIKMKVDFGSSATFIRALRTARFFAYISFTRQIKTLFETLVVTLPSLTNIGGLLLLFLYIYSVLGVFLFSDVKLQSDLDIHANFQSFGYAFMTLMRCSTGEAWDYIMMDISRQSSIMFQCSYDDFSYDQYVKDDYQTIGCGSGAGQIYFMTFYFMVPLIFLNLFIAIILEGFEQTSKKEKSAVQEENIEHFLKVWAKFDVEGKGVMRISRFNEFLFALGKPLGWDEETFGNNQKLQDLFLEELNLPTYNGFRELLFWDVIQGLTKIYIIRLQLEKEYKDAQQQCKDTDGNIDDAEENGSCDIPIDPERKLALRLELEFENINQALWEVSEVEAIMARERNIKSPFSNNKDDYTTGHIKAARKIMQVLMKIRDNKIKARQKALVQQNSNEALSEGSDHKKQ